MPSLLTIPSETLFDIVKYLRISDIVRLQETNKAHYRHFYKNPEIWLILNRLLFLDYGAQLDFNKESLLSSAGVAIARKAVLSPYKKLKRMRTCREADRRSVIQFASGYRIAQMALLPGGRWLLSVSVEKTIDIWDLGNRTMVSTLARPTSLSLPGAVISMNVCPETANSFLVSVTYIVEIFQALGEDVPERIAASRPSPSNGYTTDVYRLSVSNTSSSRPSFLFISRLNDTSSLPVFRNGIAISDDTVRGGGIKVFDWRTGSRILESLKIESPCVHNNPRDVDHVVRIHPSKSSFVSICQAHNVQQRFYIHGLTPSPRRRSSDRQGSQRTASRRPDVEIDIKPLGSYQWSGQVASSAPSSSSNAQDNDHELHFEYTNRLRPATSRYPEHAIDIVSDVGTDARAWKGMAVSSISNLGSFSPTLRPAVPFYNSPLYGSLALTPVEDTLIIHHVLSTRRTQEYEYEEYDDDSESSNETTDSESATTTTIACFYIPTAGIEAGSFTRSRHHNHIVKSHTIVEQGLTTKEISPRRHSRAARTAPGAPSSYFDLVDYDFLSGRIILSSRGSEGFAILEFNDV